MEEEQEKKEEKPKEEVGRDKEEEKKEPEELEIKEDPEVKEERPKKESVSLTKIPLKKVIYLLGVLVVVLFLVSQYQIYQLSSQLNLLTGGAVDGGKIAAVPVEFYVMSQCPFGVQVERGIKPVLDVLGDKVDFRLGFIGGMRGGQLSSMHGDSEVKGDMVQLCAQKYEPEKFMEMVVCMGENSRGIPDNWESCAEKGGLEVEKIRDCYEGEEGKQLLRESFQKSSAVGARGSPTIYIKGQAYSGGRDSNSFLQAICQAFGEEKPEGCREVVSSAATPLRGSC